MRCTIVDHKEILLIHMTKDRYWLIQQLNEVLSRNSIVYSCLILHYTDLNGWYGGTMVKQYGEDWIFRSAVLHLHLALVKSCISVI